MKLCTICRIEKEIDKFSPIVDKPGRHHPYCTPCRLSRAAKVRAEKKKSNVYISQSVRTPTRSL